MCFGHPYQMDKDQELKDLTKARGEWSSGKFESQQQQAQWDSWSKDQRAQFVKNAESQFKANLGDSYVDPAGKGGFQLLTPDATDKAVQAKKMSQALMLSTGRGRKESFLGGVGDGGSTLGGGSMLGGY